MEKPICGSCIYFRRYYIQFDEFRYPVAIVSIPG